jgi:hypothetical protein
VKINDFKYNIDDIISTDGYLSFCNINNICYIKTDFFYLGAFNWRGESHPKFINDVCVIGHSDYPVVETISNSFTKVFCINKYCSSENTFGLPLGITNDCNDSPLHKVYGNKKIIVEVCNEPFKKENLSYINFNISNYPTERQFVFDKFKNENWIKIGEVESSIKGRIKFLRDLRKSKFVFCPRGNGIDTHRIWESLYMGSIPIVKYENTHHLFTDLPILFINEWDEISEGFLNQKYKEIIQKDWNMDKLKISYWLEFIKTHK